MPIGFKKQNIQQSQQPLISVPGYHQLQRIFESDRSRIFRAIRSSDGKQVVLKILQEEYIERSEILRYKNQYDILSDAKFSIFLLLESTP